MDIQAEKIELMKMLLEVNDPDVLHEVKSVLQHNDSDYYDLLPNFVKTSIDTGIKDFENGNLKPHAEVMLNFKAKYGAKD